MANAEERQSKEIILYDIPTKEPRVGWSMNPWKTRLSLNYKKLPYKTVWVEYPDIGPKFKDTGLPPNPSNPAYSIPIAYFPTEETLIMDSLKIAERLEILHPTPSLHLDSPYRPRVTEQVAKFGEALRPVWMPLIPERLLSEPSKEYFFRTRKEKFGFPLEELARVKGGEPAWKAAEAPLKELGKIYSENEGPFVLGKEVSFADFVLAGWLHCLKSVDESVYNRIIEIEPKVAEVLEASKPWFERNDH